MFSHGPKLAAREVGVQLLCWVTMFLPRIRICVSEEEERRVIERRPALSAVPLLPQDIRTLRASPPSLLACPHSPGFHRHLVFRSSESVLTVTVLLYIISACLDFSVGRPIVCSLSLLHCASSRKSSAGEWLWGAGPLSFCLGLSLLCGHSWSSV